MNHRPNLFSLLAVAAMLGASPIPEPERRRIEPRPRPVPPDPNVAELPPRVLVVEDQDPPPHALRTVREAFPRTRAEPPPRELTRAEVLAAEKRARKAAKRKDQSR